MESMSYQQRKQKKIILNYLINRRKRPKLICLGLFYKCDEMKSAKFSANFMAGKTELPSPSIKNAAISAGEYLRKLE